MTATTADLAHIINDHQQFRNFGSKEWYCRSCSWRGTDYRSWGEHLANAILDEIPEGGF